MGNIEIEHSFTDTAHDLVELFDGINKFNSFINRLERQAHIDEERYPRDSYVGDGFEFFVELFLKLHPVDNRIGVYNYTPKQVDDNGVDGYGINIKGDPCVVQVKFRNGERQYLTANTDHIGNMVVDGSLNHGVEFDQDDVKNYRHYIFTTASGLHHYTHNEFFKKRVKCFGRNEFRRLVDNNSVFWDKAREIVSEIVEND